ncbi:MAG: ABC transporter substrate-binding protein [Flexilinea sp.]
MRKLLVLLLSALMVVSFAAFDNSATTTAPGIPADFTVGFAVSAIQDSWKTTETNSILNEGEKRGYKVIMTDAQNNTEKQIADCEDLIAQKVDMLFVAPVTTVGFDVVYEKAREAGIPVIQIDRETEDTTWGTDYITTVVSNHYKSGYDNGIWVGENTKDRDKVRVVEITGTPGGSDAQKREQGFADAIAKYPNIEIVALQTGNYSRSDAQSVMQNILQSLGPDGFDVVYTHNDTMALGTISALKAAGITIGVPALESGEGALIVTVDGQVEAVQAMIDGDINYIVACSADYTFLWDIVEKYYAGEKLDEITYTPDYYFTQDTVRTEGMQHAYDYTGE